MAPLRWDQLTGEEVHQRLKERRLVILPLGAVEAHGPHLPTGTDNLLAAAIAERVAERVGGVLLPLLPYGQVWSLQDFPGSLSISSETLANLVVELGMSLQRQGVALLALINGHMGNVPALQAAARRLYQQKGPLTYIFTYPGLSELSIQICSSRFNTGPADCQAASRRLKPRGWGGGRWQAQGRVESHLSEWSLWTSVPRKMGPSPLFPRPPPSIVRRWASK